MSSEGRLATTTVVLTLGARLQDIINFSPTRNPHFIALLTAGDDGDACEHQDCPENDALVDRFHLAQENNAEQNGK
jgi:hypothetical protein